MAFKDAGRGARRSWLQRVTDAYNHQETTMKTTKLLLTCTLFAAATLSSTAFADASDEWIAQQKARGLSLDATPTVPRVSSLPLLVEMSLTDGDTNRAAITRRLAGMYAIGDGDADRNSSGSRNINGHAATGLSCDKATKEVFSQMAQSEGFRPEQGVGCSI